MEIETPFNVIFVGGPRNGESMWFASAMQEILFQEMPRLGFDFSVDDEDSVHKPVVHTYRITGKRSAMGSLIAEYQEKPADSELERLVRGADLGDMADRVMLSDAFEAEGRMGEADVLRNSELKVKWIEGSIWAMKRCEHRFVVWGTEKPECSLCGMDLETCEAFDEGRLPPRRRRNQ